MEYTLGDFKRNQRVEFHSDTTAWAAGDHSGRVLSVGRRLVHVMGDNTLRIRNVPPRDISKIITESD